MIKTVQVLIIYSIKKTVVKIDSSCNEIAESEQIVWSSLWTIHLKYTPLPVLFSILKKMSNSVIFAKYSFSHESVQQNILPANCH